MPCSVRDMRNALTRKLGCEETEGGRHTKYKLYRGGRIIAMTMISHSGSELADPLISQMAKELCIQSQVLKKIYQCPYGLKEYLKFYNPDLNPFRRSR
jgi:hypothetical protein